MKGGATPGAPVVELKRLVSAKLLDLQHGVDVRRSDGFEAARSLVLPGHGKALMDAVRVQVTAMATAERDALLRSRADARRKEGDTLLIGAAVAAVSICIRLGIALLLVYLRLRNKRRGKQPEP